jgi:hypothetical protein
VQDEMRSYWCWRMLMQSPSKSITLFPLHSTLEMWGCQWNEIWLMSQGLEPNIFLMQNLRHFFLIFNLCDTMTHAFHIAKSRRCGNLGLNNCGALEFVTLVSPISRDVLEVSDDKIGLVYKTHGQWGPCILW